MEKQLFILKLNFLVIWYNFEGFGNELRIEGNTNGDEILLLSSNIVGTVSTKSALFGAALVLFAICLSVVYFLVQELFRKEHDDYEVLKVISHYELNDNSFGVGNDFANYSWEQSHQLYLIRRYELLWQKL